jgi:hypothetical protein
VLILFSFCSNVSRYNDYIFVCIHSAKQSGPICDRGKPSKTTEFQIVEKGILHWNQRTEVSRFRRRSEPSDVSQQKSKGRSVRESPHVSGEVLKRFLSIFSDLILDSSVDRGMPNLAAAPLGPNIRPLLSFRAASIRSFSCARSLREAPFGFSVLSETAAVATSFHRSRKSPFRKVLPNAR